MANDCLSEWTFNCSAACHFLIILISVNTFSILLFTVIHAAVDAINNCKVRSDLHGAIIVADQLPKNNFAKHIFEAIKCMIPR